MLPNNNKIAISCRLNYESPLDGPLDEHGSNIIDSGIIVLDLMNSDYKLDTYLHSYITYITWKNNNDYVFYTPSSIIGENIIIINNRTLNRITIDNSKFIQNLKTTVDGNLLVIYITSILSQTYNSWITDVYL